MFDNLNETEFENFCFDLLRNIGLQNIDWRKGTGKKTSPSDKGRDIVCEYHRYDFLLQRNVIEKWFVECKHQKEGVPPEKLSGAFTWAETEKPDRLLIIASNFLSNPCKDNIKIRKEKGLALDVEIWEKPFLERISKPFPHLLKKYSIEHVDDILNCINNYHAQYIKNPPSNEYETLLKAIERLDKKEVDTIFEDISIFYICFEDDSWKMLDEGKYRELVFNKLLEIKKVTSSNFAITSFINCVLNRFVTWASPSDVASLSQRNEHMKSQVSKKMKEELGENYIASDMLSGKYILKKSEKMLNAYEAFCNKVIPYLYSNPYFPKIGGDKE